MILATGWTPTGEQAARDIWQVVGLAGGAIFAALLLFFVIRAMRRQGRYRVVNTFTEEERRVVQEAIIAAEPIRQVLTPAFTDNYVLPYEGIAASALTAAQQDTLRALIREYVGNMDDGHAAIRMQEIERYLDQTYFAWMGGTGDDSVFYYRVHSPVVLIEFDHQGGIALNRGAGMSRNHIHTVVRTPNGNDYGKDLLRRHYESQTHSSGR